MPVRGIFIVIGSVAIVGLAGALFLRAHSGAIDDLSRFGAAANEVAPAGVDVFMPPQPGSGAAAAGFGRDQVAGSDTPAPATAPRVVLPGSQPPLADAPAPPAAAPVPAPSGGPAVDETALRYFARQGDSRRLNAEIARLHALYPDWIAPTDMTSPVPIADPQLDAMWKLYSDGQYAAARAAVADRIKREPQWKVPADLLARLDVGEARERLLNASTAKQWNTVVQIAAETPSLLTCADVDVLWRLAEAFAQTERAGRARDVDVYVLNNCQDPKERLATVQKAMTFLGDAELADLLALEHVGADGKGEFAPIRGDLARRRIGAASKDPNVIASADDLALVEELAHDPRNAGDAVLLGSYFFTHGDPEQSAAWFAMAKQRADTPEIARGLAYALNELKRPAEAEAAAYRWRDAGPENKDAYLIAATALLTIDPPVKLDPDVLARMAKAIADAKYPQGARQLGWYAYNTGQALTAARWFTAALTWKEDDEPSAFGLALAYQRLGNKAALQQVIRVWGPQSARIAEIGNPKARATRPATAELPMPPSIANPGAGQAAAAAEQARLYTVPGPDGTIDRAPPVVVAASASAGEAVVARSSARGGSCPGPNVGELSGAAALNCGWKLMELNRPVEAADAFDAAMRSSDGKARSDAAYGKTLANLRSGLTDSAAISAAAAPQGDARAISMQTDILTQRALGAYNDGRYVETLFFLDERSRIAPEQNDLLMIRGWAYFHLRRLPEAKRIFVAVAGTGSREALRALAAIAADQNGQKVGDVRDRR